MCLISLLMSKHKRMQQYAISKSDPKKTAMLKAGGEVIVSGGPFQTPKLLQLSGIGEKAILDKVGLNTVVDLPGVSAALMVCAAR
jgi:choline dehydrogenase-like flavoprotein